MLQYAVFGGRIISFFSFFFFPNFKCGHFLLPLFPVLLFLSDGFKSQMPLLGGRQNSPFIQYLVFEGRGKQGKRIINHYFGSLYIISITTSSVSGRPTQVST